MDRCDPRDMCKKDKKIDLETSAIGLGKGSDLDNIGTLTLNEGKTSTKLTENDGETDANYEETVAKSTGNRKKLMRVERKT